MALVSACLCHNFSEIPEDKFSHGEAYIYLNGIFQKIISLSVFKPIVCSSIEMIKQIRIVFVVFKIYFVYFS